MNQFLNFCMQVCHRQIVSYDPPLTAQRRHFRSFKELNSIKIWYSFFIYSRKHLILYLYRRYEAKSWACNSARVCRSLLNCLYYYTFHSTKNYLDDWKSRSHMQLSITVEANVYYSRKTLAKNINKSMTDAREWRKIGR